MRAKNGSSTSSATLGWPPTPRSTLRRYYSTFPFISTLSVQTDNSYVECHRDTPPGSADIPVGHREDPWAEHPDAGARCRAQSDWTTAAAADTARPGAIRGRSRCTIDEHILFYCRWVEGWCTIGLAVPFVAVGNSREVNLLAKKTNGPS